MAHSSPCAVVVCKVSPVHGPYKTRDCHCGTWLSPGVGVPLKQVGREGPSMWNSSLTDLVSRLSAEKSNKVSSFQY